MGLLRTTEFKNRNMLYHAFLSYNGLSLNYPKYHYSVLFFFVKFNVPLESPGKKDKKFYKHSKIKQ